MTEPDIVRLVRIDFDSLENQSGDARYETTIGLFMAREGKTALQRADEWKTAHPLTTYKGWDAQTYPQYIVIAGVPIL